MGTGKSSFMHVVEEYVARREGIKTIWFYPWKYDKKHELWSALTP